jgi:hypothetical protein
MSKQELLKELTGNEFKVYTYIELHSKDGILWGVTREALEEGCNLGYQTIYECIRSLQGKNIIEYNGYKRFAKILPTE